MLACRGTNPTTATNFKAPGSGLVDSQTLACLRVWRQARPSVSWGTPIAGNVQCRLVGSHRPAREAREVKGRRDALTLSLALPVVYAGPDMKSKTHTPRVGPWGEARRALRLALMLLAAAVGRPGMASTGTQDFIIE